MGGGKSSASILGHFGDSSEPRCRLAAEQPTLQGHMGGNGHMNKSAATRPSPCRRLRLHRRPVRSSSASSRVERSFFCYQTPPPPSCRAPSIHTRHDVAAFEHGLAAAVATNAGSRRLASRIAARAAADESAQRVHAGRLGRVRARAQLVAGQPAALGCVAGCGEECCLPGTQRADRRVDTAPACVGAISLATPHPAPHPPPPRARS